MNFRTALIARIERDSLNLAELAREAGVSYEQLKSYRQGKAKTTNVEDAIKIAKHFGLHVEQFIGSNDVEQSQELLRVFLKLDPAVRDTYLTAMKVQIAAKESKEASTVENAAS